MIDSVILRNLYPFKDCSENDLIILSKYFSSFIKKEESIIYSIGEPALSVYVIKSGFVEMTWLNEESEKIYHLGILKEGDMFGIGEIFFDTYYINTTCVTKCELLKINKEDFFNKFLKIECLNSFILKTLAYITKQRITMIDWHNSKKVFTFFIYYLCIEYGVDHIDKIFINRNLNHDNIAQTLNLSREHVTRLFGFFKNENIIIVSGKKVFVNKEWYLEKKRDSLFSISFKRTFSLKF